MATILKLAAPHDSVRPCVERGEAELTKLLSHRTRVAPRATIGRDGRGRIGRIRYGWAMRMRYMSDGQASCSAILLPGDLIGAEAALFGSQTEEIVALTMCEIDSADPDALWDAMRESPTLAARMMWQICEEAQWLRRWVVAMGRAHAEERMALLLLDIRARLLRSGELDAGQRSIPFPVTQQVIADATGLTAVHVNRVLKRLRDGGMAMIRGATATLEPELLAQLAAPLMDDARRPRTGRHLQEVHVTM